MTVRVRHIDFPVPGYVPLATALVRGRSVLEIYLLVASCAVLLALREWWAAVLLPASAIFVELIAGDRSVRLVRRWRTVRRRRIALNDAAGREARRAALLADVETMIARADSAWRVYMNDAAAGRTHSVIHDRPAPKIQSLERLDELRTRAAALNIDLVDEDAPSSEEHAARLPVPPIERFEPDTLSPTMMNLTAESLAHAKAEGGVRARRRHALAIDHAGVFAPALLFAERAAAALRG